jgi:hypothetical protein
LIIAGGAWNGLSQNLAHFIACKSNSSSTTVG